MDDLTAREVMYTRENYLQDPPRPWPREVVISLCSGNADDFAIMERGEPDTARVLLGWDEVGLFDSEFKDPMYVRLRPNKGGDRRPVHGQRACDECMSWNHYCEECSTNKGGE